MYLICMVVATVLFACQSDTANSPSSDQSAADRVLQDKQLQGLIRHLAENDIYAIDNQSFTFSIATLSDEKIQLLVDSLPDLEAHVPSITPILQIAAQRWGQADPKKTLDLIAAYDIEIPNLYVSYTKTMRHWLDSDPQQAEHYIFDTTTKWSGPAGRMGEDLREIMAVHKLKAGTQPTFDWLSALESDLHKLKAAEALFVSLSDDSRLAEFANWMSGQTEVSTLRFLFGKLAEQYTEADPVSTLDWIDGLPNGSAKYIATRSAFKYLGGYYPNIGAQWFNTARNRYQFGRFNASWTKLISATAYREDFIAAFVEGLVENKETDTHPSEIVKSISDKRYRPLVEQEYLRQMRRADPISIDNY